MDQRRQIVEWLRPQADFGDDLTSRLIRRLADDIEAGGDTIRSLAPIADLSWVEAPALRVMGAAHRLALAGDAPGYAAHLPTCGGDGDVDAAWTALAELCASGRLRDEVLRPVQTNEVRRCAALLPAFGDVADTTGLPLRLLEIGCSAGLLLRFDRYRYEIGDATWGDPSSPVRIGVGGEGPVRLPPVAVASRRGCDPNPLDPVADRLLLLGFIWPDQLERFGIAEAALDLAAREPVDVDRARAQEWLAEQLASPVPGVATVVYHSIVFQYLPSDQRRLVRDLIRAAGERATGDAPLAWVTFEPSRDLATAELGVTLWPGGERRVLAQCGFHGDPVRWVGAPVYR